MTITEQLKKYSIDIITGKIIACKYETLACKRFLNDLQKQGTTEFPYVFDETRAQRVFDFFGICIHVQGCFSEQPIKLQIWQKFDLGNVYGWVHKDSGKRRFRTAYIRIARGNTKSTMMSGCALYGLNADSIYPPNRPDLQTFEMQPQVVCGAVDREQADIVWSAARQMAMNSPVIANFMDIMKNSMSHKKRSGSIKKLSKETKNKDGFSPTMIIIDEYHSHPTSLVKDVTSSGKGKRPQSLEVIITTAGEDAENKPCYIEDGIVKQILEGGLPVEDYFCMIRELDEGDDVHNPDLWVKSNPMFREQDEYSINLKEQVQSEHDLAYESNDPSKIRQWLIKRANLWQTDSEEKYFSNHMDDWKSCAVSREEFFERVKGKDVICGVDLSKHIDLTGIGWVVKLPDGVIAVHGTGFIPKDAVEIHRHTDKVPYENWIDNNWVVSTPGGVTDDKLIEQHIIEIELENDWNIKEICYDPYSARQFSNDMSKESSNDLRNGNPGYECVEVRQGVQTLSEPTKKFRELVIDGKIIHCGSPLLTWCLSNAYEVSDNNGNIKLSKKNASDSQRIDPLAAIMNAMTRIIVLAEENVYESRGMLSLCD